MAVKFGFFNSVNHDRQYDADDISNYYLKLISNGVFATPSDNMQVQASQGMTVQVNAGWGIINCKWIDNNSPYLLTLAAADVALNRIDRVVLRLNPQEAKRNIEIAVKRGTTAKTPTAPALTREDGGTWELSLAQIYVGAGVTEITQAKITDERPKKDVCGWVTGLIDQIDTTELFAQYDNAFWAWFNKIKETVATSTLIRRYTQKYVTTGITERVPIQIPQYNDALDVVNVYVNGMKLTPIDDYTIDSKWIVLKSKLDVIGTPVEIEILKSVDGSKAETVIEKVEQLEAEVQELQSTQTTAICDVSRPSNDYYVTFEDSSGKKKKISTNPVVSPWSQPYTIDNRVPTYSGGLIWAGCDSVKETPTESELICVRDIQVEFVNSSGSIVTFNEVGANKIFSLKSGAEFRKYTGSSTYAIVGFQDKSGTVALLDDIPAAATKSQDGLLTAEDKKKLDDISSTYLPVSGGAMTGNIDTAANQTEIIVSVTKSSSASPTVVVGGIMEANGAMIDQVPLCKSFIGTYKNASNSTYYNIISTRHRNGYDDGNRRGMIIYSDMEAAGNLRWNKQGSGGLWQGVRTLLDSVNFASTISTQLTTENLDSLAMELFTLYYADTKNTCTNTPVASYPFLLLASCISASAKFQVAFYPHNNKIYMRSLASGAWSAWSALTSATSATSDSTGGQPTA